MDGRDSFWLDLHMIARAIEQQGTSRAQRTQSLVEAYEELVPVAQDEVRSDLAYVMAELQAIHARVTSMQANKRRPFCG